MQQAWRKNLLIKYITPPAAAAALPQIAQATLKKKTLKVVFETLRSLLSGGTLAGYMKKVPHLMKDAVL